jgi:phage tail sheath protein FI
MEPVLPEQAPAFTLDDIEGVQQAMLLQCEQKTDRFAVLDPPPPPPTNSFSQVQSWRHRFDSKFGALYHPWVLVPDPLRVENRPVRRVPPCGVVTGVYAGVDLEQGVHHAPANRLIQFALGPLEDVSEAEQEILNPLGINCLRELPGRGFRVWGARTISRDTEWIYVNVRRLMSLIEEALEDSLAWAVFQPNGPKLRRDITASIHAFLETLWEAGALVGNTADEAFYVRCDEENNPPSAMDLGKLLIEIGVAPVRTAEFVVIRIGRIDDSFEIEERGRAPYGR